MTIKQYNQWWIQDFPEVGVNPKCWGVPLLFWSFFPKNYMKMKRSEPRGSANDNCFIFLPLCWNFKLSRRTSSGSCLTFCAVANTEPSVTKVTSATDDTILLRVHSPCLSYFQSNRVLYIYPFLFAHKIPVISIF